jgi:hypothetical protein
MHSKRGKTYLDHQADVLLLMANFEHSKFILAIGKERVDGRYVDLCLESLVPCCSTTYGGSVYSWYTA